MASILALDLGSTQLKLLLLDENARVTYVGTQGIHLDKDTTPFPR